METFQRRYDIDWLRVVTIGLLLIYHIAIVFQPWALFIGFIQSKEQIQGLWVPMQMLNVWRIPILFVVSGMGVGFAMQKRNWKNLLMERTRRIFLPLVVGAFIIVPIHIFLLQKHYNVTLSYHAGLGHLWFLANIFIYVIVLLPIFVLLKRSVNSRFGKLLIRIYNNPLGIMLLAMPIVVETWLLNPSPYVMYAQTMHGFMLGLLAFFYGFTFVLSGKVFWTTLLKWWWLFLSVSVGLYALRYILWDLNAPNYLFAIETHMWCIAVLAIFGKWLNKPGKVLSYLSQGAYPVYIVHMIYLYAASAIVLPMDINVFTKLVIIVIITYSGSLLTYDLIRRIIFLRPLFGLKSKELKKQ